MSRLVYTSLVLVLSGTSHAAPANPADYFPLVDGARWIFAIEGGGSNTLAVQTGTVSIGGIPTREVRFVAGRDVGSAYFYTNTSGVRLHREYDVSEDATITYSPPLQSVSNPFDTGSSATSSGSVSVSIPGVGTLPGTYSFQWEIVARGPMTTPAGFFCDVVKRHDEVTIDVDGDVYRSSSDQYAVRGVGIVSESGFDDGAYFSTLTSTTLPLPPADRDCDGFPNVSDLCPYYASASILDTDGDHRGDVCECGDQNGDGRNTVSDLVAINLAIFNPGLITPLCDANGDGLCTVSDIVAVNIEIFSPTNTSTCARQPVAGP